MRTTRTHLQHPFASYRVAQCNQSVPPPLLALHPPLLPAQDDWKLDRATVERFLFRVQSEYLPKPYHNQVHASDVTQTSAIIMQSVAKQLHEIPKLESFCVIIGAAVHDLGHLGVNNDFLINSKHPRATTYNDRSVNENYHISRAFELMRTEPGCDIFERLSTEEQKKVRGGACMHGGCAWGGSMRTQTSPCPPQCRKLMIDAVLATDMAIHFDLLKNFNEQISKQPDISQWEDRSLLYQMVVHLADIANPARPFHLARNWAERVIVEFCAQVRVCVCVGVLGGWMAGNCRSCASIGACCMGCAYS
jgi:hypothetical protein